MMSNETSDLQVMTAARKILLGHSDRVGRHALGSMKQMFHTALKNDESDYRHGSLADLVLLAGPILVLGQAIKYCGRLKNST